MGTRADYYVGRGADAEWLGSTAWDGYEKELPTWLLAPCASEAEWRDRVSAFLAKRDDATTPDQGWPWPWDDSRTTDRQYTFDAGEVLCAAWGCGWWPPGQRDRLLATSYPEQEWPDMRHRKSVTLGERSGLLVMRPGKP